MPLPTRLNDRAFIWMGELMAEVNGRFYHYRGFRRGWSSSCPSMAALETMAAAA